MYYKYITNMGIDNFNINDFRNFMFSERGEYFEEKEHIKEYIYDFKLGELNGQNCKLRIYSSIDTRTDSVRDIGEDAIRVNICDKYNDALLLNNERYKHIKRTGNWKKRLSDRIDKYTKQFPQNISLCPECSSPLKIKSGKYGKFISCSSWSPDKDNCEYTKGF